jgi:hypothetical protein
VQFIVMRVAFEVIDDLLPVCGENIPVSAMKALIDLDIASAKSIFCTRFAFLHLPKLPCRILEPAHNLELRACLISV